MTDWVEKDVTIVNTRGLHARAAARFVKEAEVFDATVEVVRDAVAVNGGSIMGLLMLGASPGTNIVIRAQGAQATDALDALAALVARRFDEE